MIRLVHQFAVIAISGGREANQAPLREL
jgi:hypothetical protein